MVQINDVFCLPERTCRAMGIGAEIGKNVSCPNYPVQLIWTVMSEGMSED